MTFHKLGVLMRSIRYQMHRIRAGSNEKIMKSLEKSTQNFLKIDIKSQYHQSRKYFFGRCLALYFRNPLARVVVSKWFIETRNNLNQ